MAHIQTTIAQFQRIVPLVLASGNQQPVGLIGPVGVGKTQYFKGWFRDMYAEAQKLSLVSSDPVAEWNSRNGRTPMHRARADGTAVTDAAWIHIRQGQAGGPP